MQAYIKKLHLIFVPSPCYFYESLRPTGRWKMESGPEQIGAIYVEHQGALFNRWIHEDSIVFSPKEEEEVFSCRAEQASPKIVFVAQCIASLLICGVAAYCAYISGKRVAFTGIATFILLLIWNKEG